MDMLTFGLEGLVEFEEEVTGRVADEGVGRFPEGPQLEHRHFEEFSAATQSGI